MTLRYCCGTVISEFDLDLTVGLPGHEEEFPARRAQPLRDPGAGDVDVSHEVSLV